MNNIGKYNMNFSEKQLYAYNLMLAGKNVFITGQGGVGKCLGINTPIIMFDGSIKMIQNIKEGELVMGDDSNKRKVLSTTHGISELYLISNDNGDSFVCNEDHILTFKAMKKIVRRKNMYSLTWGNKDGSVSARHFEKKVDADVYSLSIQSYVDIPLMNCINKGETWRNYFRTVYACVKFKAQDTEVDPYIFGVWLGFELGNELLKYIKNMKLYFLLLKSKNSNFRDFLRRYDLKNNLHIPHIYKVNSEANRMKLISGMMDANTDSSNLQVVCGKKIADDIAFVSRSLGISTHLKIVGENLFRVTICREKDFFSRETSSVFPSDENNYLTSKISIKSIGVGEYFGFELDKNHRFVLGNFLISHNSHIISSYIARYRQIKKIGITSMTGVSALLIKGTTLHSYTGIKLGKGSAFSLATKIKKDPFSMKRWRETEVLIIDEVSMLKPDLFDKLEEIARIVRRNELPFGGIQLILSGDFCQLPFITTIGEDKEKFCCDAETWRKCIEHVVYITEIMRQKDFVFQNCLNNVRLGNVNDDVKNILNSRLGAVLENEHNIVPTKLYPLNVDVEDENERQIELISQDGREFFEYVMDIVVSRSKIKQRDIIEEIFKKNCIVPEVLQICVGAQVMLLVNLNLEEELANGSRGVVVRFQDDIPVVRFLNGNEHLIDHYSLTMEENEEVILTAYQIPLKVAFAVSIHKCQGITLDYAEVDLGRVFEYGQAYTALSRVKNLDGLSIRRINYSKIIANPRAIQFYQSLEEEE